MYNAGEAHMSIPAMPASSLLLAFFLSSTVVMAALILSTLSHMQPGVAFLHIPTRLLHDQAKTLKTFSVPQKIPY